MIDAELARWHLARVLGGETESVSGTDANPSKAKTHNSLIGDLVTTIGILVDDAVRYWRQWFVWTRKKANKLATPAHDDQG